MKARTFILSDESINTYGFRLLTGGADLSQFRKNPVMYLNHDSWDMPIGRWENIRVEDGKILADAIFDMKDEKAAEVAGKVDRGFLKMASVGLVPIERTEEASLMLPGQKYPTVSRWRLREASIVGIGSNHNALRLYDENDKQLDDDEIMQLFDKPNLVNYMNKEFLTMLELADTATAGEATEALRLILADNKRLNAENGVFKTRIDELNAAEKAKRTAEATALVDEAVKDGRLDAGGKATFLELFEMDYDKAKQTLNAIPKRGSVKSKFEQKSNLGDADFAKFEKQDWNSIDKTGQLSELRDKFPDLYVEKFKERFGCEPSL